MNVITKSDIESFFPKASITVTADEIKIHAENFPLLSISEFLYTFSEIKEGVIKRSGRGVTITIKK